MTAPEGYFAPDDPLEAYRPDVVMLSSEAKKEALESTGEPGHEERHLVQRIVVLTLAAILAVKALDWLRHAKKWEENGRFDPKEFERTISREFTTRLTKSLVPAFSRLLFMGRGTVAAAVSVDAPEQAENERVARAWARAYANKVAKDYAATSASTIGAQLPQWLSRNLPAAAMATRARDLYGLDPRAAAAVSNYGGGKVSPALNVRSLIERYIEHRALTNATVYAMAAQNAGRELLFTEMVEAGLLPPGTKKVWVTAHDERTCPVCRPMDGRATVLNTRFHVAGSHLMTPPVHPNCRCTIGLDVTPHAGFVFPKRYDLISHWVDAATKSVFG